MPSCAEERSIYILGLVALIKKCGQQRSENFQKFRQKNDLSFFPKAALHTQVLDNWTRLARHRNVISTINNNNNSNNNSRSSSNIKELPVLTTSEGLGEGNLNKVQSKVIMNPKDLHLNST